MWEEIIWSRGEKNCETYIIQEKKVPRPKYGQN